MSILIVTGIEGARNCADVVAKQLGMDVETAEGRKGALAALRQKEFAAVVIDDTIAECDPAAAETIWERAGLAIPIQVNFALSGTARLIRDIRAALNRREREQSLARKAAAVAIETELKSTVAGLLLQSELALSGSDANSPLTERLRIMADLAGNLRRQLARADGDHAANKNVIFPSGWCPGSLTIAFAGAFQLRLRRFFAPGKDGALGRRAHRGARLGMLDAAEISWKTRLLYALLLCAIPSALAQSVYTTRLEDPRAVYLDAPEFGARPDGGADSSAALQAAIDKAEGHHREGIVFVPEGRYRLDHTVYIWPGVRVIGFGGNAARVLSRAPHAGVSDGHGRHGDVHRVSAPAKAFSATSGCRFRRRGRFRRTTRSPTRTQTRSTRR